MNNLAQISFATDMVFADGTTTEMSTVSGSVADGYNLVNNALRYGKRADVCVPPQATRCPS